MTATSVAPSAAAPAPRVRRAAWGVLAVWAVVLIAGFALVFGLGSPLPTQRDQRQNAYAPLALPLTEQAVLDAADRIVHLDYPQYINATRTSRQGTSGGLPIWTVTYSIPNPINGVRIIVSGKDGSITVTKFP